VTETSLERDGELKDGFGVKWRNRHDSNVRPPDS
jgi:hypothetical protein